jgi:hypothetical protein
MGAVLMGDNNHVAKEYMEQGKALDTLDLDKKQVVPSPTRAASALQLRIDGASYSDIAKVLEFRDAALARYAVEVALANEARSHEDVEQMRWIEARRLERVLSSLMRRATNPTDQDHLAYARTALAVIDRHIKLYGLDAPSKVDVTYTPSKAQLDEFVNRLTQAAHGPVIEADIVDAEIVED